MRFRRKRSRVLWLPNVRNIAAAQETVNYISGSIAVLPSGVQQTAVYPLVKDSPPDETTSNHLADFTQGGYLLKRIVGKLFVSMSQFRAAEGTLTPSFTLFSAGIEVLRVDNGGNALSASTVLQYSPLEEGNETDPWIWRRDWMLANGQAAVTTGVASQDTAWSWGQPTNATYGSVMDGPHVDVKVGRRIGPEERLFLSVTTHPNAVWDPPNIEGECWFKFVYRVLAVPIRSTNRRNASR